MGIQSTRMREVLCTVTCTVNGLQRVNDGTVVIITIIIIPTQGIGK